MTFAAVAYQFWHKEATDTNNLDVFLFCSVFYKMEKDLDYFEKKKVF